MGELKKCSICGGNLKLTIDKKSGDTWKGDWFVYKCLKCKEGFTTTESDEISLSCIKKINNN